MKKSRAWRRRTGGTGSPRPWGGAENGCGQVAAFQMRRGRLFLFCKRGPHAVVAVMFQSREWPMREIQPELHRCIDPLARDPAFGQEPSGFVQHRVRPAAGSLLHPQAWEPPPAG